jgi:uncharacterized protein
MLDNTPDIELRLALGEAGSVSALFRHPEGARACYVMAHGAGAGMTHASMQAVAAGLGERGVATLRFQFPFMENGTRRPDPPKVAHAAIRAAVGEPAALAPDLPLFAGGRSFGGRMTSQTQAATLLPGVHGLIFLAFPLHPAGRPSTERADHLSLVHVPMLFIQGTRDALAEEQRLRAVVGGLPGATLIAIDEADHSFHVPARSGRTDAEVRHNFLDKMVHWMAASNGGCRNL